MSKRRKPKTPCLTKDHEAYQHGPFRIERVGRMVSFSSHWKPGQFEEWARDIKDRRPEIKSQIDAKIAEFLSVIRENDSLTLLESVSMQNLLFDPEEYRESAHEGVEAYVEYALSAILGHENPGFGKKPPDESIKRFAQLIEEIFLEVLCYFGTEAAGRKRSDAEDELRFLSIMRFLFVRGDSIQEHHIDLVRGLFRPHDAFLMHHFGVTTDEFLTGIEDIERQVVVNLMAIGSSMAKMKEHHELFKQFVEREGIESFCSVEDCFEKFRVLPEMRQREPETEQFRQAFIKSPFLVKAHAGATEGLLDLLSAAFGDNASFVNFEKTPAWPTNDSIIHEKPLLRHKGKHYFFSPQLLFRSMISIIQSLIRQKDEPYFLETYQEKRAEYLEQKALEYFTKLLPGATAHGKLYYHITEKGQPKRVETDGLIIYDANLFILEAKAGELSISARRGGLERMKKHASELIDNAYSQALRTKKYIEDAQEPRFEREDGTEALVMRDRAKIQNTFLVNVTLENLSHLAIRLNSLKTLNLIKGREWPWSVFINDLRIISELIEFPSQFLVFLQRRIRANDFPQFQAMQELDYLMYYFNEGLCFEDTCKKGQITFIPHAYTEPLDRYFDFLAGRVSTGKKPSLKMREEYKTFVRSVESLQKEGFTKVTTFLLNFDAETQKKILEGLKEAKDRNRKDGRAHDVTLYFKTLDLGLSLFVASDHSHEARQKTKTFCELKKYQTRMENWVSILVDANAETNRVIDFDVHTERYRYDQELEKRVEAFRSAKWEAFRKAGQAPGRNDPCPCNSGLKYKRCCGK